VEQGARVEERPDRTHQRRDDVDPVARRPGPVDPGTGAADRVDLVAGAVEAGAGEEHVVDRAADDKLGDDVGDPDAPSH
jgi:hypothetical protein